MISREGKPFPEWLEGGFGMNNNCFGGLFSDNNSCCWIIIVALIVLCCCCH